MEIKRLSSGIESIDKIIKGFPEKAVICYRGDKISAKKFALLELINKHSNPTTLVVSTQQIESDYIFTAKHQGLDISEIRFIDAASWRIRRVNPTYDKKSTDKISNLTDLNAFLAAIISKIKEIKNVEILILDSLSSLLLYSTPGHEQVFKFFELLSTYTRSLNITLIYDLDSGIHQENIISSLLFMSDGQIDFKYSDNKQLFKISHLWLSNNYLPIWEEITKK